MESSHAPTARFRTYRQGAWLFAWVALGIVSYGGVWVSFTTGEKRSFSAVANLNLQLEQEYQSLQEERSKQISLQKKKRLTKPSEKEKQQRKKQSDREHRWAALGLWMAVVILSYHRIKRDSQNRSSTSNATSRQQQLAMLQTRRIHREVIVRTLRRINRERQARQEELISLEAIEAFQSALLQDREIWMGLAAQDQQASRHNRGATPQQVEACPQRTPLKEDSGDCPICLTGLRQDNAILRTLPCNHSYHTACIDRWLDKSTLCPICKCSLEAV